MRAERGKGAVCEECVISDFIERLSQVDQRPGGAVCRLAGAFFVGFGRLFGLVRGGGAEFLACCAEAAQPFFACCAEAVQPLGGFLKSDGAILACFREKAHPLEVF